MRVMIFEGTPEEIAQAIPHLTANATVAAQIQPAAQAASEPAGEDGDGTIYVSTEVARRALSRRALSIAQRAVLAAIYRAHPKSVLASALQKEVGYTAAQFAGLMGALGRRIAYTEGYEEGTWFFNQEWDYDAGCVSYALPESVRAALEAEKIS